MTPAWAQRQEVGRPLCCIVRRCWAMCFNRIVDVNNTEDPDADGAPPLEVAVRHERTLEGVGPIP
jgi:hypothetical protein